MKKLFTQVTCLTKRHGRSSRGETFTEVLVSILISSLGVAILAAAVAAALHISQTSTSSEDMRAASVSAAEAQLASTSTDSTEVTMRDAGDAKVVLSGEATVSSDLKLREDPDPLSVKAYITKDTSASDDQQSKPRAGFESLLVFTSE